jgi:hypothetical protein
MSDLIQRVCDWTSTQRRDHRGPFSFYRSPDALWCVTCGRRMDLPDEPTEVEA